MTIPPSLRSASLVPLWEHVRSRLERAGVDNRGRLRVPELDAGGRQALVSLLGRSRLGAMVDLATLEERLVRLGVGSDLSECLEALGHPVSTVPSERRARTARQRAAHVAARDAAAVWTEPWGAAWANECITAGVFRGHDAGQARGLVLEVMAVLDALADPDSPQSRAEFAARVCGSAHSLDRGTRLEAAVARALAHHFGPAPNRELWERAGIHLDLTSGPVLTWNLPVIESCGLAPLVGAARQAGVPLHLSRFVLEEHPIEVAANTQVLVVENPRLVEAAAQRSLSVAVAATNGQPSSTVLLLLDQLGQCGATIWCHADFDPAGLAICSRLVAHGATPWRMARLDYERAIESAARVGVILPPTTGAAAAEWDPSLAEALDEHQFAIHEERLLPDLLTAAENELRQRWPS